MGAHDDNARRQAVRKLIGALARRGVGRALGPLDAVVDEGAQPVHLLRPEPWPMSAAPYVKAISANAAGMATKAHGAWPMIIWLTPYISPPTAPSASIP